MSLMRLTVVSAVIVVAGWASLPYVDSAAHRAESLAAFKHTVLREPETPRTVTVYQSTGSKGEAVFADARHDQGRGQARVVDNSKGSTFHTEAVIHDEDSHGVAAQGAGSSRHYGQGNDPIAKMQRDQLQFQQRAAELKQKQMDRVIGE